MKNGGGTLLLAGDQFLQRRDDRQRRHAGSQRLDSVVLGRERRRRRDALLQPLRRLSRLRRSDHRLGNGADLPRGARLRGGPGRQHLAASVSADRSISPAAPFRSAAATPWAAGPINVAGGASYCLATSATTTFSNPITLNGIGATVDGYAKPAIYGDGSGGVYTVSSQITLAATSDVGNYKNNGMLTFSGKITGPGGLVIGKTTPTLADEYGPITIVGHGQQRLRRRHDDQPRHGLLGEDRRRDRHSRQRDPSSPLAPPGRATRT